MDRQAAGTHFLRTPRHWYIYAFNWTKHKLNSELLKLKSLALLTTLFVCVRNRKTWNGSNFTPARDVQQLKESPPDDPN